MRQLTKKALSLVLCVMLVVSAISCVFSITADTGYTTVNGKKVYDAPVGLELDGDLSKWENITAASGKPVYVAENGVLMAADGMAEMNAFEEVGTRFRIPNAVAGTKVKLSFVYHVDLDKLATEELKTKAKGERLNSYVFRQYSGTGATITNVENNLWYTDDGKTISSEFTMTASDDYLRIVIGSCKSCKAAWSVTDIKVEVTHTDGTVETYPATEEEEPEAPVIEPNPPKNLDFSEGFSYWKGETSIYSVENGVLKVNDTYTSGSWRWLKTEKFNIPNAVAGTTVKLTFDVAFEDGLPSMDGNANQQPTLESTYGYKILDTYLYQYNADGTEKTNKRNEVFYNEEGTVTVGTVTITDPAEEFEFHISCGNGAKKTWEVTNITVTATHPDGTVDTYPATEGDEEGDDTTPEVVHPDYYGPDDKGFNSAPSNKGSASWPCFLKPAADIYNLDFEYGFRYWTGHDCSVSFGNWGGSRAYSFYDLVTEGGNTYIQAKTPYQTTIMTAIFTANNAAAGDELVIIYDAKGADATKLRPFLRQAIIKANNEYDETTGLCTNQTYPSPAWGASLAGGSAVTPEAFAVQTDATGWTTYIMGTTDTVKDYTTNTYTAATCLSDVLLQVKLSVSSDMTTGTAIDAAIDNIRIAKVANGVYTDIATNEVIYTDPTYGKVAKVGDDYFATLQEAIDTAGAGDTITLLDDIALAEGVVIAVDDNIVLDLNGKTISRDTDAATSTAAIVNNGTLTIEDNVGGGKITAYAANPDTAEIPYYASNTITNCGVLTIKGGTIENSTGDDARAAFPIDNNSTVRDAILNIEGGTISGRGAIRQFANSTTKKNEVNITGGTVSGTSYAIWMQNPGSGDPLAALNISGGTVAKILLSPSANFEPAITGGTISEIAIWSASGDANRDPSGFITGGTFNTAVDSTFCAEGYVPVDNGDGTFGVEEKDPVATINGVKYYSLQEAIDAANENDTIVLLAPIVVAKGETLTLDKNVIITYTSNVAGEDMITNNGTLIIDGTTLIYNNTDTTAVNVTVSTISSAPGSVLEIKSGVVKNVTVKETGSEIYSYAIDLLTNGNLGDVTATISGGTVYSDYMAIRQFNNGDVCNNTLTITGGYIYGAGRAIQVHLKNNAAHLTISGGTIEAGEGGYALCIFPIDADYISVVGGSFIGTVYSGTEEIITGGTFNTEVYSGYLAEGLTLADNGDGTYGVVAKTVVATVNGVNYYSLQEAIDAANGGTVILATNVALDAPLTIAKDANVTIDLNGLKITYTSTVQGEAMISNKGTLTINDTVGGGEIYYDYVGAADPSYGKGNYTIDNAGTLTLNGGKINIATLRQHAKYPINNNSTTGDAIFVMNGGSLYNYNTSAIRQFCNSTVYNNSVTINGGLVEGYSAIWVQNPGKNTVNATLTINGGEIRTTAAAYVNGSATVGEVSSKIYFTTEGGAWSETSAVVITGGTFNENVYLATNAPASLTVDEEAPIYNGYVELPVVEEYDLETELYWVKGFKPAGSEDTRYGFLMTIGIDSLDYKKDGCGFYLTVGDTTKKFIIVNGTVWESLSVDLPEGTKYLAPVDFGEGNNYIMHYTVYFTEAELAALGSMEVSVKGFVTTFEGEELVTKTFNCGTLA